MENINQKTDTKDDAKHAEVLKRMSELIADPKQVYAVLNVIINGDGIGVEWSSNTQNMPLLIGALFYNLQKSLSPEAYLLLMIDAGAVASKIRKHEDEQSKATPSEGEKKLSAEDLLRMQPQGRA